MPGSSSWMPYAPQGVKWFDDDDDDEGSPNWHISLSSKKGLPVKDLHASRPWVLQTINYSILTFNGISIAGNWTETMWSIFVFVWPCIVNMKWRVRPTRCNNYDLLITVASSWSHTSFQCCQSLEGQYDYPRNTRAPLQRPPPPTHTPTHSHANPWFLFTIQHLA